MTALVSVYFLRGLYDDSFDGVRKIYTLIDMLYNYFHQDRGAFVKRQVFAHVALAFE